MTGLGKGFVLGLVLMAGTAHAAPPEVMEPYREYAAAIEAGDRDTALSAAERAYTTASKVMPDDAKTGMLAINYANLMDVSEADARIALFDAALAVMGKPADQDAWKQHVDVMIKRSNAYMYNRGIKTADLRRMEADTRELKAAIVSAGLENTTFDAEAKVMESWAEYQNGNEMTALEDLEAAAKIFDSPSHTYFSALEYQANLLRGAVLQSRDKHIDAALALQKVMQNMEGELPADHPYIQSAFSQWVNARSDIQTKGMAAEALEAGVCKCWPYDEMSANAPVPLKRINPRPPARARNSGQVFMKFDVGRDGKPINIRATSGTDRVFIKPSKQAIEKWEYDVQPEHKAEDLTGLTVTMMFVYNGEGRDEVNKQPMQIWESEDG